MPVQNIECQIAKGQIGRYLAGDALSTEAVTQLEAHIGECEHCQGLVADRRAALVAMLDAPTPQHAVVETNNPNPLAEALRNATKDEPKPQIKAVVQTEKPQQDLKKPLIYSIGLAVVLVGMSYLGKSFGPKVAASLPNTPPAESTPATTPVNPPVSTPPVNTTPIPTTAVPTSTTPAHTTTTPNPATTTLPTGTTATPNPTSASTTTPKTTTTVPATTTPPVAKSATPPVTKTVTPPTTKATTTTVPKTTTPVKTTTPIKTAAPIIKTPAKKIEAPKPHVAKPVIKAKTPAHHRIVRTRKIRRPARTHAIRVYDAAGNPIK